MRPSDIRRQRAVAKRLIARLLAHPDLFVLSSTLLAQDIRAMFRGSVSSAWAQMVVLEAKLHHQREARHAAL